MIQIKLLPAESCRPVTMVFPAAQTNAFFRDNDQIGLPVTTENALANEGLVSVEDLADFDEALFKQIAENLRRPTGPIPNPDPNAPPGSTIPQPFLSLGQNPSSAW